MSGYLQRLLERGVGLASAPAVAPNVAPALVTGSPTTAFDQRLAMPGLAQDFGIFGLTPDGTEAGETFFDEGGTDLSAPRPAAPTPMAPSSSIPGPDAPLPRQAAPAAPIDGAPLIGSSDARKPIPIVRPEISARLLDPPVTRPNLRPAEETGRSARRLSLFDAQPLISPRWLPPSPVERGIETPILRETASALIAGPAAPFPASIVSIPPRDNQPTVMPRARGDQPPLPATAPPVVLPKITPAQPVSPPPLVPPPPVTADALEFERIVREAVRSELARVRPTERRKGDSSSAAANDAEKAPATPPRPATAREASVIGDLEPSSRPLTIYGLRRR